MREERSFGIRSRALKSEHPLKKYLLVYEGEKTEYYYFQALNNSKRVLGINPLIEIIPILRSFGEKGWSNPQKFLDRLIKNLKEEKLNCWSYETILNRVIDQLIDGNFSERFVLSDHFLYVQLKDYLKEHQIELHDTTNNLDKVCTLLCDFFDKNDMPEIIDYLPDFIKQSDIVYEDGYDEICIIVDRDCHSFSSEQYWDVLNKCKVHKFSLCVTNPCFEFWLLLHYDDIEELDYNKLLENPKISKKKSYAENELCKRNTNYKKNHYNAQEMVLKVDVAIQNEKKYCENVEELDSKVGSNLGLLIEKMRDYKR